VDDNGPEWSKRSIFKNILFQFIEIHHCAWPKQYSLAIIDKKIHIRLKFSNKLRGSNPKEPSTEVHHVLYLFHI